MKKLILLILSLVTSGISFGQYINKGRQDVITFYDTCQFWIKIDSSQSKVCYKTFFQGDEINSGIVNCFYFNDKDICYKKITLPNIRKGQNDSNDFLEDTTFYEKYQDGYIDKLFKEMVTVEKSENRYIYITTEIKK